jgi:hypothetical protein
MSQENIKPAKIKAQLHDQIKKGNIKKTIDYLLKITKDDTDIHQKVILLNTSLSNINEAFIKGMISVKENEQNLQELGQRTLMLIDDLSEQSFVSDFQLFIRQNLALSIGVLMGILLLSFWIFTKLNNSNPIDTTPIISDMKAKLGNYKRTMCADLKFQQQNVDKIFLEAEQDLKSWKNKYKNHIKDAEKLNELDNMLFELKQIKFKKQCID